MTEREPVTGPIRMARGVMDYLEHGPDPVAEAEAEAFIAAQADPRSYEAKKAWREAHPDRTAPSRPTGRSPIAVLGEWMGLGTQPEHQPKSVDGPCMRVPESEADIDSEPEIEL